MLSKRINLFSLEKDYPFNIRDIILKCKEFEIKCNRAINPFKTLENSSDSKNLLIEIINLLISKLRGLDLSKSNTERENWYKLQRDVSNCSNFLEMREKELVTGTGETEMDKSRLIVLLGDYMGVYRTMILNILKEAKEVYNNEIKDNKNIQDKKRAFFWVLYELLQVNSGLYEMRISSSSGSAKTIKVREPWQGMLVQSMRDEMRQSREIKMDQIKQYAEQIKNLVEEYKLPVPKSIKDKGEKSEEDEEDYEKEQEEPEEDEEPLPKSKSKKPKTGGKKMEDDFDKEDDEDSEDDDGDWEE